MFFIVVSDFLIHISKMPFESFIVDLFLPLSHSKYYRSVVNRLKNV